MLHDRIDMSGVSILKANGMTYSQINVYNTLRKVFEV